MPYISTPTVGHAFSAIVQLAYSRKILVLWNPHMIYLVKRSRLESFPCLWNPVEKAGMWRIQYTPCNRLMGPWTVAKINVVGNNEFDEVFIKNLDSRQVWRKINKEMALELPRFKPKGVL